MQELVLLDCPWLPQENAGKKLAFQMDSENVALTENIVILMLYVYLGLLDAWRSIKSQSYLLRRRLTAYRVQ